MFPKGKFVKFISSTFHVEAETEFKYIEIANNIPNINMSLINYNISDCNKIIAMIEEFTPKWLYIQPLR